MPTTNTTIRHARLDDAPEMARLAAELGYPMTADDMAQRLAMLLADDRHCVFVVDGDGALAGWGHVEHRVLLEEGDRAEVMGLVVDARSRRIGVGRALIDAIEAWSAARGIGQITVRSNVVRQQSHPFYLALGYSRSKTQHVYVKPIAAR
jgi:GNAT superfamily N-acetyltransferase